MPIDSGRGESIKGVAYTESRRVHLMALLLLVADVVLGTLVVAVVIGWWP